MITPLLDHDTLDVAGLERLVEHIIAGGVHGLFILGTTGEAPNLSYRLRRELIDRTCRLVAGRIPVLVGVTDPSFAESVDLARHAAAAGVSALVAAPPFYFPATQDELAGYFHSLAEAVPLPLFLYNMPTMTKLVIEPDTVRACLNCANIIGVKDSGGNLGYFEKIVAVAQERSDWSVFIGPEHLMAESVSLGGNGGVNGGANVNPRLFVDLYDAAKAGDSAQVLRLQAKVMEFGKIYEIGRLASSIIKGLKCSLSLLGICDDAMSEPFRRFEDKDRAKIRQLLEQQGLLS